MRCVLRPSLLSATTRQNLCMWFQRVGLSIFLNRKIIKELMYLISLIIKLGAAMKFKTYIDITWIDGRLCLIEAGNIGPVQHWHWHWQRPISRSRIEGFIALKAKAHLLWVTETERKIEAKSHFPKKFLREPTEQHNQNKKDYTING